jgi:hypothetical protein
MVHALLGEEIYSVSRQGNAVTALTTRLVTLKFESGAYAAEVEEKMRSLMRVCSKPATS